MSREALRAALMDAKKMLRGERAKAYRPKKEKDDEPKEAKGDLSLADEFIEGGKGDLAKAKADNVEDKEGPVDFAEEIKGFMKKQRVSVKDGPTKIVSFHAKAPVKGPALPPKPKAAKA